MRAAIWVIPYLLLGSVAIAQDPDPNSIFPGEWWNERCSKLDIQLAAADADNRLVSGLFVTGVGSGSGTQFKITGFAAGDMIAFSAALGSTGSLTSWSGQHTIINGTETIVTQWLLAANLSEDADEEKNMWRSLWTGADSFVKQKPSNCP